MRRRVATLSAALAAALVGAGAPGARAETGIDAQLHKPALDSYGIFSVERAKGLGKYDFNLRIGMNFAQEPLKLDTTGGAGVPDGTVDPIFESTLALNFGLALGLTDRLSLSLDVPIYLQPLGDGYGVDGRYAAVDPSSEADFQPGTGFFSVRPDTNVVPSENIPGDARLGVKYRFLTGKLGVAFQGVLHAPFGDEDVFAGSAGFTLEPKVIVELPIGKKGAVALNLGARVREGELAEVRRVDQNGYIDNDDAGSAVYFPRLFVGTEGVVGVGAVFAVTGTLGFGAEAVALIPIAKADEMDCGEGCRNGDLTADVVGGAFFGLTDDMRLAVGAGAGLISDAARSESFRVVAALSWTPTPEGARVGGRGDADGDNIADGPDVCPDEPEDVDDFQDDDGCPELDNDLDGILDAQDKCPSEPEDRDGYDDGDGCAEGDNDKDDVPDLTDRCPGEPEDGDGYQDDDGCPDEDNDGDGILDAKDNCPNEAETVNGYLDLDGCPDQGVQGGPKLTADRIDLQGERIEFAGKSANLTKASQQTLDAVAAILIANWGGRTQLRFRISVGVERTGDKPKQRQDDRRLSADRAEAVRQYLVGKGVNPQQLDVEALGSDFPIDKDPKSPANRRVEFIRLTQQNP